MPDLASSQLRSEPRDREARLLAELVRLSPTTLLLAESESDKSGFLECSVMPLLAGSAPRQSEICLLFDCWTDSPLPALLSRIASAVSIHDERSAGAPSTSLAAALAAWQASVGTTFIIILDRFEEHLAARARPGAPEFEDALVDVLTTRELRAHFVIAVDEDAAALLEPLKARIPGFGDTVIRLPAATVDADPQLQLGLAEDTPPQERLLGSTAALIATPSEEAAPTRETPPARGLFESAEPTVVPSPPATDSAPARFLPRDPMTATAERVDEAHEAVASSATGTAESTAGAAVLGQRRLPRAAWAVLGLLVVCAMGLLLLTIWEPKRPAPEHAHEVAASAVSGVPTASTEIGSTARPAAATLASTPAAPAASPAGHHQATHPISRNERPRARAAPKRPAQPRTARTRPLPRPITVVYVHVRSEAQRAWAEQLVQPLATRGVRVTGIRVVSAGPREANLRFFRAREANEAARVARVLREVGLPHPTVKRVRGLEKRSTPRQYELWLAPEKPNSPHQRR
jgi:hypothetical protein